MIIKRLFHVTIKWVLLTILIFNGILLNSQEVQESVHYLNYTINDGLPSNETYDVFHDSKGFLWIGTDNGVVRYDGQTFETFTTLDGLTDNTVFKIEEDYLGRIWFMTYNRELCYYEDGEFKEYWFNEKLVEASKGIYIGHVITNFNIDTNDNIELTLVDLLSIQISGDGKKPNIVNYIKPYASYVNSDDIQTAYLIADSIFQTSETIDKIILSNNTISSLHFIKKNNSLYIGSKKGLTVHNSGKAIFQSIIPNFSITGVSIDFEGGLWCSSLYNGIIYIPNKQVKVFEISSKNISHIHGIIQQNENLIFCFAKQNNFYKFDSSYTNLFLFNENLDSDFLPESINNGIKLENPLVFNGVSMTVTSLLKLNKNQILYACDKAGLTTTNKAPIPLAINNRMSSMTPNTTIDNQGYSWNSYPKLGFAYMKSNPRIYNQFLHKFSYKITKLFKDVQHQIWVSSTIGLFKFDTNSHSLNKQPYFEGLRTQDIVQTKDRTMFFATKANGIYSIKDSIITNYNIETGLLSNTIYQLVYDSTNNRIWATTNNGITVLNRSKSGTWTSKAVITKYDGLKSKDIRQLAFQNGYLFFANNTGVSKINLSSLFKDLPPPILELKKFISNGKGLTLNDEITLPYDSNNIQLVYHAISYKSLNDVTYEYQLSPIDKRWRSTKNGHFNFQALQPNQYTFKIRAVNIDQIASAYKEYKFTIRPAFWMTFWFKAVIIIIAIYIGYRLSLRSINTYRNQANMEKSLNKLRVISLQAKMNPHFIFNSLNSIQNFILKNEKEKANDYLLEFSKLIRIILQNSDSTSILLSNELDTLRLYVGLEMKRLRNSFKYRTDIDPKINIEKCHIPSLLIQPYVENAIWHGKVYNNPEGEIFIQIKLIQDRLHFEISDNGIGIKNAEKSKVNKSSHNSIGSQVTQKRIELLSNLNQELSEVIISENNMSNKSTIYVGTRVSFSIPYYT